MLALVLEGERARLVRDHPRPLAGARAGATGQSSSDADAGAMVRVRMRAAGICSTDLELARGYMGFAGVLGHEFVGEALDGDLAGRRVVGEINFGCGRCRRCERGMSRHCAARRVLGILGADGALAEELIVPRRNLIEVPASVDDDEAVFTEPVAAACEILEQLGTATGYGRADGLAAVIDAVGDAGALVLGDGKLGPLVAQVLAAEGFDVTLVGHHLERLGWLADRGVKLTPRLPEDARHGLVVEATGSAEGLRQAVAATEPRGTLVLKTTVAGEHRVELAPLVIDEITVIGSRCGRFGPALERLADRRVLVRELIDARYPLAEVEQAFAHAARGGTRKVLVEGV